MVRNFTLNETASSQDDKKMNSAYLHERIRHIINISTNGNVTVFAKKIGVSQSTLHRNLANCDDANLIKLCGKIVFSFPHVPKAWLFVGSGEPPSLQHQPRIDAMNKPITEHSPLTELGKELKDILTIGTDANMTHEELCAAFLGRIGVNHSCWPQPYRIGAKLKDPQVQEA